MKSLIFTVIFSAALTSCTAETPAQTKATYLGNEAVMVEDGQTKILLDPLFPNGFGVYQQVPADMRADLIAAQAPYNDVDAIFVSHIHPDHFSVLEIIKYLESHTNTHLYAPQQALEWMQEETEPENPIFARVTGIALDRLDAPLTYTHGAMTIDAVRIPHAGWPDRADISNLVYRITLSNGKTIMHMGDADPRDEHYAHHGDHWHQTRTDTAFPPYWFFYSGDGPALLEGRLNTENAVGVHVPITLPAELITHDHDYFHKPGETRIIGEDAE